MLHTHTPSTRLERERGSQREEVFAEKLNALVKKCTRFLFPSPLLLLSSLGAQMSMRIASLFSCRLSPLSSPPLLDT